MIRSVWSGLLVGITMWSGLWLRLLLLLAVDVFALLMNVHCLCQSMVEDNFQQRQFVGGVVDEQMDRLPDI